MVTTEPFRGPKRQKLKQYDRYEIPLYRSLIFFEKMLKLIENNRFRYFFLRHGRRER